MIRCRIISSIDQILLRMDYYELTRSYPGLYGSHTKNKASYRIFIIVMPSYLYPFISHHLTTLLENMSDYTPNDELP